MFGPKPAAELTSAKVKQDVARRQLAVARLLAQPGQDANEVLRESYRRASQRLAQR